MAIGTRSFLSRSARIVSAARGDFRSLFGESCGGNRSANRPALRLPAALDEPEQRFVGQRKERAAQHAGQAQFVGRAGHRAEQVEHVVDFLLGVKRVAADEVVSQVVFAECFFVQVHVAQRAEQDGDVAQLHGPRLTGLPVDDRPLAAARIQQAIAAGGRSRGPPRGGLPRPRPSRVRVLFRRDRPQEFDGRRRGDLRSAGPQRFVASGRRE